LLALSERIEKSAMHTLTIRRVPDELHRALRARAAQHGRSAEAEMRLILEKAVSPSVNLAQQLNAIGAALGGVKTEFARDKRPYRAPEIG
jgi:antitoxin FitA